MRRNDGLDKSLNTLATDPDVPNPFVVAQLRKVHFSFRPIPAHFNFTEPGSPCSYWSSGAHIVSDGKCRCGRYFYITEGTNHGS